MSTHAFSTLELNRSTPGLLIVTLNRPQFRNAIDSVMMRELRDLWQELYVGGKDMHCVVLTGAGDKAFCAGADLKERNGLDAAIWKEQHAVLEQAMVAMLQCPVPIIAAVNGAAFGGGLELMLASDFAYVSEHATFGFPETKLGIMPGALGTQNLPRACGIRRAKEICFSAATFSAAEAYEWGIANKICASSSLMPEVLSLASQISGNAPLAIRQAKKALNATQHMGLEAGYRYEIEAYNQLLATRDREEGVKAFNEKRKPVFSGQ